MTASYAREKIFNAQGMEGVVRLGATCGAASHGDAVTAFTHEDMTYDNADTEGMHLVCSFLGVTYLLSIG